jgi:hypothetical protein
MAPRTVADMSPDDLADAIVRAQRLAGPGNGGNNNSNNNSNNAGSAGGDMSGIFAGASNAFNNLTNAGDKLVRGQASSYDAMNLMTQAASAFPSPIKEAAQAVNKMGTVVLDTNTNLKEAGQTGASFGNNLGEYNKSVMDAQLTQTEFNGILRRSSGELAGLGPNMTASSKAFLGVVKEVQNSEIGVSLQDAGVSAKELAEATQLSMHNARASSIQDEAGRKRSRDAAIELATVMDDVAKITGKSKEAQAAGVKAVLDRAEVDAGIALKGEDYRKSMTTVMASFGEVGPSVQELVGEIASGGVRTKEGAAKLAALGPAGQELQSAMAQHEAAIKSGNQSDIAAATMRLDASKKGIVDYMNSEEGRKRVAFAQDDAMKKMYSESLASGRAREASEAEFRKEKGIKDKQALTDEQKLQLEKYQKEKLATERLGLKPDGTKDPGAAVAESIREVDRFSKLLGTATGDKLNTMNTNVGNVNGGLQRFNDVLRGVRTGDQAGNLVRNTIAPGAPSSENRSGASGTAGVRRGSSLPNPEDGRLFGSPGIPDALASGDIGKMFENFGPGKNMTLHGKEAVVRPEQLTDIVKKFAGGDMQKQLQGMMPNEKQMAGLAGQMKSMMPDPSKLQGLMGNMFSGMGLPGMDGASLGGAQAPSMATPQASAMPSFGGGDTPAWASDLNSGIRTLVELMEESVRGQTKLASNVKNAGNRLA